MSMSPTSDNAMNFSAIAGTNDEAVCNVRSGVNRYRIAMSMLRHLESDVEKATAL
jgi:hypothetical protein